MNFRLAPTSVTLDDLNWCNGRYFALFYRLQRLWEPITAKWLRLDPYCLQQNVE